MTASRYNLEYRAIPTIAFKQSLQPITAEMNTLKLRRRCRTFAIIVTQKPVFSDKVCTYVICKSLVCLLSRSFELANYKGRPIRFEWKSMYSASTVINVIERTSTISKIGINT